MDFWEFLGFFIWGYIFFAYLVILFAIVADIFRDAQLNGWLKAMWILLLVFIPFITALIYVISRGRAMGARRAAAASEARADTDDYIRSVAAPSASEEIAKARELVNSGAISQSEYEQLKARALAGSEARVS
jgi:hypothetical protein